MTTNKQLRELAEKATQGDWTTDGGVTVIAAGSDQLNNGYAISECHGPESPQNADFIAAISPATVLALLDAYEALQAECEELRKDAERYRWLKPHLYVVDTYSGKGISYEVGIDGAEVPDIDDVTEAIDAAMQRDQP